MGGSLICYMICYRYPHAAPALCVPALVLSRTLSLTLATCHTISEACLHGSNSIVLVLRAFSFASPRSLDRAHEKDGVDGMEEVYE